MVDANLYSQLTAALQDLEVAQQRQVLEYALNLRAKTIVGVPGSSLMQFAGRIDAADLNAMSTAIEAGCEAIDADGW